MTEPIWIRTARKYIGIHERPGPESDDFISKCLARCGYAGDDDSQIPWCGCFAAEIMFESGYPYPNQSAAAMSWRKYGTRLDDPDVGAIVVFAWRSGGHHVGFVVDYDDDYLYVLGGNQGDQVSIAKFGYGSVIAYRWPKGA